MIDIRCGDALVELGKIPDESVQCCVTSPPYWGLRDYGVEGQMGLEKTPEEYVGKMVGVFREVRRVLRNDGTLWLNLGDSYSGSGKGGNPESGKQATNAGSQTIGTLYGTGKTAREAAVTNVGRRICAENGISPKQLMGIPWRVAFALQADGWWLRQDIIWHKPNPMPESVTDRCTKSHEYIFLLTKSSRYFFDHEAIKEQLSDSTSYRYACATPMTISGQFKGSPKDKRYQDEGKKINGADLPSTRNKRSVWTITTQPYSEAHFATFPPDLIKPCILAGTSARGCCPKCGAPWERVVQSSKTFESGSGRSGNPINGKQNLSAGETNSTPDIRMGPVVSTKTTGWQPTCECNFYGDKVAPRLSSSGAATAPSSAFLTGQKRKLKGPTIESTDAEHEAHRTDASLNECATQSPGKPKCDPVKHPVGVGLLTVPCTILDPFAGSGTTGMVAIELGLKAILIELNPKYIELIKQRTFITPGLPLA